mgnify:CR=1 FL=1
MRDSGSLSLSLATSEPLASYSEQVRQEFEEHLAAALATEAQDIVPMLERGTSGGKRLRPVLCRLASDALEGDAHLAFECGVALELIHSGALIHDDWIDGDEFRRDAPALWQELGPRTAVLVADLMIATGSLHGAISEATSRSLARCIRSLSEGAIADFTDHASYTEAVYLKRIKRKTASLYGTAAELGALVCNEWDLPEEIAAAISTQNEPESELRPDPVFFVSDLSGEIDETWREHFKEGVLTHHDVSEEALDKMLDEADGKARELVRLIS